MSKVLKLMAIVEDSDWVSSVDYNRDTSTMTVVQHTGKVIEYSETEAMYNDLTRDMDDFLDKDGYQSAGAAVSYYIKHNSHKNHNAIKEAAQDHVDKLSAKEKQALWQVLLNTNLSN